MELQAFVSETIRQIYAGVSDARGKLGPQAVAPRLDIGTGVHQMIPTYDHDGSASLVEFDVAITATDKTETGGGGGITVLSLANLKAERTNSSEQSSVSRIKFSVPINYD